MSWTFISHRPQLLSDSPATKLPFMNVVSVLYSHSKKQKGRISPPFLVFLFFFFCKYKIRTTSHLLFILHSSPLYPPKKKKPTTSAIRNKYNAVVFEKAVWEYKFFIGVRKNSLFFHANYFDDLMVGELNKKSFRQPVCVNILL